MLEELRELPWFLWVIIPPVLIAQGTWLFIDARRRGSYPWFWGVWGMIYFPLPLVLYFIFVRKVYRHFGKRK